MLMAGIVFRSVDEYFGHLYREKDFIFLQDTQMFFLIKIRFTARVQLHSTAIHQGDVLDQEQILSVAEFCGRYTESCPFPPPDQQNAQMLQNMSAIQQKNFLTQKTQIL
jgi:hypothetical protein